MQNATEYLEAGSRRDSGRKLDGNNPLFRAHSVGVGLTVEGHLRNYDEERRANTTTSTSITIISTLLQTILQEVLIL